MFEIHLVIPESNSISAILETLRGIGQFSFDSFVSVLNVSDDARLTHDPKNPAVMASATTTDIFAAADMIANTIRKLGAKGNGVNFELEEVISEDSEQFTLSPEDKIEHLPALRSFYFNKLEGPAYENHIIWNERSVTLPDDQTIVSRITEVYGYPPDQIVEFKDSATGFVCRVATIYQRNRETTLECAELLNWNWEYLQYSSLVTERVHLVGRYDE